MRILFTGSSSFTGYWFANALADAGHEVVAIFRRQPDQYAGLRQLRATSVAKKCHPVFGMSFGSDAFVQLIRSGNWDMLCHHAVEVRDYKSPEFDVMAALANNTMNLPQVLTALREQNCHHVLITGTFFEQDEGEGGPDLRAFSPYGLSKGLAAEVFRYYCHQAGIVLGKFVIPNPFGPYEDVKFTTYLAQTWLEGKTPILSSPQNVRDNIHVSLLAELYVRFAEQLRSASGERRLAPSFYAEDMAAFTERFARAMRPRLGLPCEYKILRQTDFSEPLERVNTDSLDPASVEWDEQESWDDLAQYHQWLAKHAQYRPVPVQ